MSALLQVLRTAGPRLMTALRGNLPLMERIALRLKLATKGITPEKIYDVVKSNGLAAVLVFNEVFGHKDSDTIAVAGAVDNGMNVIDRLSFKIDDVSTSDVEASQKFDDEYVVISDAVGIAGSLDRLMILAKAVQMPQSVFAKYRQDASRARAMRL